MRKNTPTNACLWYRSGYYPNAPQDSTYQSTLFDGGHRTHKKDMQARNKPTLPGARHRWSTCYTSPPLENQPACTCRGKLQRGQKKRWRLQKTPTHQALLSTNGTRRKRNKGINLQRVSHHLQRRKEPVETKKLVPRPPLHKSQTFHRTRTAG